MFKPAKLLRLVPQKAIMLRLKWSSFVNKSNEKVSKVTDKFQNCNRQTHIHTKDTF